MAFPLVFDPVAVTTALMGAYAVLDNPIVKRLLDKAADAAGEEAGKQTLQATANGLKRQAVRVMTAVNSVFGPEAATQLKAMTPDNIQTVQQAIEQEIKTSSQQPSETELAHLLEEIETLREETEKLTKQAQAYEASYHIETHGSYSPVTTGDASPITINVGTP